MTAAQAGIFNEKPSKYYYLEYQLDYSKSAAEIKKAIKHATSNQNAAIDLVVSFGKQAWNLLNPAWTPKDLVDFETLVGVEGHTMPATQGDLFFWIQSDQHDENFDVVLTIQSALQNVATNSLDLMGFTYHEDRDLIGFVDGTANPKADDRYAVAQIAEGLAGSGGCYVMSQKWVHDLTAFNQLSVHQQEQVVGRTKVDDIELSGSAMPIDSHVSRTDVAIDGEAMKIYRRSDPYGSATEHGLYFLAFSCELRRFSIQLERMLGMTDDGIHDKLIEYSKAVTGSYWFAPSSEDLSQLLQ